MYIYIYLCIYIYIYIYTYTYIYLYIHIHFYICIFCLPLLYIYTHNKTFDISKSSMKGYSYFCDLLCRALFNKRAVYHRALSAKEPLHGEWITTRDMSTSNTKNRSYFMKMSLVFKRDLFCARHDLFKYKCHDSFVHLGLVHTCVP